jgi:hypothetical protein
MANPDRQQTRQTCEICITYLLSRTFGKFSLVVSYLTPWLSRRVASTMHSVPGVDSDRDGDPKDPPFYRACQTELVGHDPASFGIGISWSRRFATLDVGSSRLPRRSRRKALQLRTSCSFCSSRAFRTSSCTLEGSRESLSSKLFMTPCCTSMLMPMSSDASSKRSNWGVCDHIQSSVCRCQYIVRIVRDDMHTRISS